VRAHQRGNAFRDRRAKRSELHFVEPLSIGVDDGQLEVRIGSRVAMAGKMLPTSEDPALLHSAQERDGAPRGALRIRSKRTVADHRVVGSAVHVEDGRVVHRESERAELLRLERRDALDPRRIEAGNAYGWRNRQHASGDAGHPTAFLVDRRQERQLRRSLRRDRLEALLQLLQICDISFEKNYAAALTTGNRALEGCARTRAFEAAHEELPARRPSVHGPPV
jgi:hypothetical protein